MSQPTEALMSQFGAKRVDPAKLRADHRWKVHGDAWLLSSHLRTENGGHHAELQLYLTLKPQHCIAAIDTAVLVHHPAMPWTPDREPDIEESDAMFSPAHQQFAEAEIRKVLAAEDLPRTARQAAQKNAAAIAAPKPAGTRKAKTAVAAKAKTKKARVQAKPKKVAAKKKPKAAAAKGKAKKVAARGASKKSGAAKKPGSRRRSAARR